MKAESVLAIFAHPDDESWIAGAMIDRLARRGTPVSLLTFTRGGNAAAVRDGTVSQNAMKKLRSRELAKACTVLGIRRHRLLDFPDGRLDQMSSAALERQIRLCCRLWRPTVLMTFSSDGVTGHRDHKAVAAVVRRYVRSLDRPIPVVRFTFSPTTRKIFHLPPGPRQKLISISTGVTRQRKLEAIRVHASQHRTLSRLRSLRPSERQKFLAFEHVVKSAFAQNFVRLYLTAKQTR